MLSAGVDFDTFARQVAIACKAGASGYLAGRAIWKEGVTLTGEAQMRFWQETARPRLQQLAEIASEHARPWTNHYPYAVETPAKGWHQVGVSQ